MSRPISVNGFKGVDTTTDPHILGKTAPEASALAYNYRVKNGIRSARGGYRPVLDFASSVYPPKSGAYFPYGSKAIVPFTEDSYDDTFYVAKEDGGSDKTACTVEFWYRANQEVYERDICKIPCDYTTDDANATSHMHVWFFRHSDEPAEKVYLHFAFVAESGGSVEWAHYRETSGGACPMDGEWHHVSIVRNAGTVTFHVDAGSSTATTAVHSSANTFPSNTTLIDNTDTPLFYNHIEIGGGEISIADFRIWKKARDLSTEISQDYQQELAGTETDLVCYVPFNEGTGKVFTEKVKDVQGYFTPQEPFVNNDNELSFTGHNCMAFPSLRSKFIKDASITDWVDESLLHQDDNEDAAYDGGILWDTNLNYTVAQHDPEISGVYLGTAQLRIRLRQLKEGVICGRLGMYKDNDTSTGNFRLFLCDESNSRVYSSNAVIDNSWIGAEKTISIRYNGSAATQDEQCIFLVDDSNETDGTAPMPPDWAGNAGQIVDSAYEPYTNTYNEDDTSGAMGGSTEHTEMCVAFELIFFRQWHDLPHLCGALVSDFESFVSQTYDVEDLDTRYKWTLNGFKGYIPSEDTTASQNVVYEITGDYLTYGVGSPTARLCYIKIPFHLGSGDWSEDGMADSFIKISTDGSNEYAFKQDVWVKRILSWEPGIADELKVLRDGLSFITQQMGTATEAALSRRYFNGAIISNLVNYYNSDTFKKNRVERGVFFADDSPTECDIVDLKLYEVIEDDSPLQGIEKVGPVVYQSRYLMLATDDRENTIYGQRSLKPQWCDGPLSLVPTALPPVRGIYRYTSEDELVDKLVVVAHSAVYEMDASAGTLSEQMYAWLDQNGGKPVNFSVVNNKLVVADDKSMIKINDKGNWSRVGIERPVDIKITPDDNAIEVFGSAQQYGYTAQFYDSENGAYSGTVPIFSDHGQNVVVESGDTLSSVDVEVRACRDRNVDGMKIFRTEDINDVGTSTDLFLINNGKNSRSETNLNEYKDVWSSVDDNEYLPTKYVGTDVVPKPCSGMGVGFERLFLFGHSEAAAALYWSDVDALGLAVPDVFPIANSMIVEEGETTEGIAVVEFSRQVFAFKDNAIFRIYQEGAGVFGQETVYKGVGCVNQRSVRVAADALYFLDKNGPYVFKGGEPTAAAPGLVSFFQDDVDQDQLVEKAFMLHHKAEDLLLFFVPASGSTYCDRCVVLDLRNRVATIDLVPEVTCGYVDDSTVYLGTPYGQILKYDENEHVDVAVNEFVGEVSI